MLFKKDDFLGLGLLASILLGALSRHPLVGVVLSLVFSLLFLVLKTNELSRLKYLLISLALQNLLIGIGASISSYNGSDLSYLTQIPTIFAVFCFAKSLFKKRIGIFELIFFVYLGIVALAFLVSDSSFTSKIIYARNFVFFGIVFFSFSHMFLDETKKEKAISLVSNVGLLVAIAGLLLFFAPNRVWDILGVRQVYIAKGNAFYGDLPPRFFTTIFGMKLKRVASLLYEPVNCGYFLIPTLFCTFIKHKKLLSVPSILIFASIVLSFAKGAYLILLLSFVGFIIHFFALSKIKSEFSKFALTFSFIVVITLIIYPYFSTISSAFSPHVWGIRGTIQNVLANPLGYGLGSGGNIAFIGGESFNSESDWLNNGGETGLLNLFYQMGVIFGFFFIVIWVYPSLLILKNRSNGKIAVLFAYSTVALLVTSIFQENSYTPQCVTLYFASIAVFADCVQSRDVIRNESSCFKQKIRVF